MVSVPWTRVSPLTRLCLVRVCIRVLTLGARHVPQSMLVPWWGRLVRGWLVKTLLTLLTATVSRGWTALLTTVGARLAHLLESLP